MVKSSITKVLANDMKRFWRRYGDDPEGFFTRPAIETWLALLLAGGYRMADTESRQQIRDRFHRLAASKRLPDDVASLAVEAMAAMVPPNHRYLHDVRRMNAGCSVLLPRVPWTRINPRKHGFNGAFILAARDGLNVVPRRLDDLSSYASAMNTLAHLYERRKLFWQQAVLFQRKGEAIITIVQSFPDQAELIPGGRGLYSLAIRRNNVFHIPCEEAMKILMHANPSPS